MNDLTSAHGMIGPRTAIRQRVQQLLVDGLPVWDARITPERVSVNRAIPLSPKKLPAVLIYSRDEKIDKEPLCFREDGLPTFLEEFSPKTDKIPGITRRLGDEPEDVAPGEVLASFAPRIGRPHEQDYQPMGGAFERPDVHGQGHDRVGTPDAAAERHIRNLAVVGQIVEIDAEKVRVKVKSGDITRRRASRPVHACHFPYLAPVRIALGIHRNPASRCWWYRPVGTPTSAWSWAVCTAIRNRASRCPSRAR